MAPDVTAELDAPEGYAQVQAAYLRASSAYAAVAEAFAVWGLTRPGSSDNSETIQDLAERVGNVNALTSDLIALLHEHGLFAGAGGPC